MGSPMKCIDIAIEILKDPIANTWEKQAAESVLRHLAGDSVYLIVDSAAMRETRVTEMLNTLPQP